MNNPQDFPYLFESNACKTCGGKCCRGSAGYVWLTMAELEEIAVTRKMDLSSFARQYVRQVNCRLSLQDRVMNGEHYCCFFDIIAGQCTIYQNRPTQCRTFPFWEKFKTETQKLFAECPGVTLR